MPTRDIKPAPSVGSWYKGIGCVRETREVLRGSAGRVCRGPAPTFVLQATASDSDTELGHLHEQGDLSLEPLQAYILHLTCVSRDVVSSLHALFLHLAVWGQQEL